MEKRNACEDCISVHGDTEIQWLSDCYPFSAEWWPNHKAYLCDGCAEERDIHTGESWCAECETGPD